MSLKMHPALRIKTEPKKNNIMYLRYSACFIIKIISKSKTPHAHGQNKSKKPIGLFKSC